MKLDWNKYPNFGEHEFTCQCGCGDTHMHPTFMAKLQKLRTAYDAPMVITSGYRCPDHNNAVATSGFNGVHTMGIACDIAITTGTQAHQILTHALALGFSGVGIRRKKDGHDFIHLDTATVVEHGKPRPSVWHY